MLSRALAGLKENRRAVIAAAAGVALVACLCALSQCAGAQGGEAGASEGGTQAPARTSAPSEGSKETPSENSKARGGSGDESSTGASEKEAVGQAGKAEGGSADSAGGGTAGGAPSEDGGSASAPSSASGTSGGASAAAAQAEPERRWVEDTSQVWVVDQAAWDEQVPVYAQEERSICNVCGADLTDGGQSGVDSHTEQHMLAGEGGGWHSEVHQVVTGYETVHHDERGHWETVVTGGHWE